MMPYGHNPPVGEDSKERLMLDINEYSSCILMMIAIEKLINFVDFFTFNLSCRKGGYRRPYFIQRSV